MTDTRPVHPDITEEMWARIDEIIRLNKPMAGSVIAVLRECQDVAGYLPAELLGYISRGLNLPQSTVFSVATFYSLFSLTPKGRHTVRVCLGTACYVKGIREVTDRICRTYHVEEGGTSDDRRFSLEGVRCLGACGLAPVAVVDNDIHGGVTPSNIVDILEEYA